MNNSNQNKSLQNIMIVVVFTLVLGGVLVLIPTENNPPQPYDGDNTSHVAITTEANLQMMLVVMRKLNTDMALTNQRIDNNISHINTSKTKAEVALYQDALKAYNSIKVTKQLLFEESKEAVVVLLHRKYGIPFEYNNNTIHVEGNCQDMFQPNDIELLQLYENLSVECSDGIFFNNLSKGNK